MANTPYIVTDLDAVESFGGEKPGEGGWKPVRAALDIQAFGVNAFVGREVGSRVLEEHTEEGAEHEELYVVLSGTAKFELGEDKVDARAGSLVFIRDTSLRRTAFAGEPNTTVLAIGSKPGAVYTPSSWDNPFKS